MSIVPAVKEFWNGLVHRRNAWDKLRPEQIDQILFGTRATFNQWSAKAQAQLKEELQHKKQAAAVAGSQRELLCRQALGARRRSLMSTRVAQSLLGVIEMLEQLKINREAYVALKQNRAGDLAVVVGQLEASRDALGRRLIEVESIPAETELPGSGFGATDPELADILREVECIETLKAEGKSDVEIESAISRLPEKV